jgi:hypothetical protein
MDYDFSARVSACLIAGISFLAMSISSGDAYAWGSSENGGGNTFDVAGAGNRNKDRDDGKFGDGDHDRGHKDPDDGKFGDGDHDRGHKDRDDGKFGDGDRDRGHKDRDDGNGSVTINNSVTVNNGLTVTGGTTTDSLTATTVKADTVSATTVNAATVNANVANIGRTTTDTLKVNGTSTFGGLATFNGGTVVNNGLTVNGGTTTDTLTVSGNASVGGTLTATTVNATTVNANTVNANVANASVANIGTANVNVGNIGQVNAGSLSVAPGGNVDMGGNVVHDVGTPIIGTDAANKAYVDRGVNKAFEGTAVALAIAQPVLLPGQTVAIRGGWGDFIGQNAFGLSVVGVIAHDTFGYGSTVSVDTGVGLGTAYNTVGGRLGVTVGFGAGYAPIK